MAVAEELHFARAAERLHIEQSPLSRAIKELEEDLGAQLFVRTTRSTRLTHAGRMFLEHVPRVFASLQQARDSVKAAANGFQGQLRIALSDGISPTCFSTLLALCRQEEPETEIRLVEVSLSQQIKGLHDDLYDMGFAKVDDAGDGFVIEPVWHDPLMVVVPARHPLLAYKRVPLDELVRYPLALGDTNVCEGYARQIDRAFRQWNLDPLIAERVTSFELMMTLVSAGFAIGLAGASQIAASPDPGVVARPVSGGSYVLTTYLLRANSEPSDAFNRLIERVFAINPPRGKTSAARPKPAPSEEIKP